MRGGGIALALLLISAALLAATGGAQAALEKPAYTAGDRWTYILQGSLGALPGFSGNLTPTFRLGLNGLVQVDVVGTTNALVGGASVPAVQVATHATGFLNGTFGIPGNTSIGVSGTFASDTSEVWEGQDFLPVASNSSSSYAIDVTLVITTQVRLDLWLNATTAYGSLPPFNLSAGQSAAAPFTTTLAATTSVAFFGQTQRMANETTAAGTWSRQVLSQESVSVEAGTFSAYRLNESLGDFPGFAGVLPAGGANETAWWSNEVSYYVKRVAYVNGTPVAEMRLKSYTYPAAPGGLSLVDGLLLAAIPAVVVAVLIWYVVHRERRAKAARKDQEPVGPIGELPPKDSGGRP